MLCSWTLFGPHAGGLFALLKGEYSNSLYLTVNIFTCLIMLGFDNYGKILVSNVNESSINLLLPLYACPCILDQKHGSA